MDIYQAKNRQAEGILGRKMEYIRPRVIKEHSGLWNLNTNQQKNKIGGKMRMEQKIKVEELCVPSLESEDNIALWSLKQGGNGTYFHFTNIPLVRSYVENR